MKNIPLIVVVIILSPFFIFGQSRTFSDFQMDTFRFEGHEAKVVVPNKKNELGNWLWRARFWGHEPQTDLALLDQGFHIAYVDVGGLFGNQEAVERWNKFYEFIVKEYSLHHKVSIEAMSRGGLIAYNWSAENVEKVACIYADAPVCDIRSWPGGKYKGMGSEKNWEECLKAHKLNETSVLSYEKMPIYTAIKVAEAGIPVLHVCGGSDEVVPYGENTALLAESYKEAGGHIEIILKEGVGHHPHSLEDPTRIVDFILKNSQ